MPKTKVDVNGLKGLIDEITYGQNRQILGVCVGGYGFKLKELSRQNFYVLEKP